MSRDPDAWREALSIGARAAEREAERRRKNLPSDAQCQLFEGTPGLAARRQAPRFGDRQRPVDEPAKTGQIRGADLPHPADPEDPPQRSAPKFNSEGPSEPPPAPEPRSGYGGRTPTPENASQGHTGVSDPTELQMTPDEAIETSRAAADELLRVELTDRNRARIEKMLGEAPLPWPDGSTGKPEGGRASQQGFGEVPGALHALIKSDDEAAANLARNEFIRICQGQSTPRRAASILAWLRERAAAGGETFAGWDEAAPLAGDAWGVPRAALTEIVRTDAWGNAVTRLWSPAGEYLGLWPLMVNSGEDAADGTVTLSDDGELGVVADAYGLAFLRGQLPPAPQPTLEGEGWRELHGLKVRPFTGPLKVLIVEGESSQLLETLCKVSAWAQLPKTIAARGGMPVLGFAGDPEALGDAPWREGDVALVKRATAERYANLSDVLWRVNVEVL